MKSGIELKREERYSAASRRQRMDELEWGNQSKMEGKEDLFRSATAGPSTTGSGHVTSLARSEFGNVERHSYLSFGMPQL